MRVLAAADTPELVLESAASAQTDGSYTLAVRVLRGGQGDDGARQPALVAPAGLPRCASAAAFFRYATNRAARGPNSATPRFTPPAPVLD